QHGTRSQNRWTTEGRSQSRDFGSSRAAEATGILPLDYMLSVMRDAKAEPKRRDAMAMAAAPYLHPKLSTVEAGQSQPELFEPPNIQVTFVRAPPRHEDGTLIE